jgi:hypothetical protein
MGEILHFDSFANIYLFKISKVLEVLCLKFITYSSQLSFPRVRFQDRWEGCNIEERAERRTISMIKKRQDF